MSQIRDQFQTQTQANLEYTKLRDSLDKLFLDRATTSSVQEGIDILEGWKTVHAPTWGTHIPQTAFVLRLQGVDSQGWVSLIKPDPNEIYTVQAVILGSGSSGTNTYDVAIEDHVNSQTLYFAVNVSVSANSFADAYSLASSPFTIDGNTELKFRVKTGTGSNGNCYVYASKQVR